MYDKGTIKLTWINPSDYTKLESKMFSNSELPQAIKEGKKLGKFMIFRLIEEDDDSYSWKLLNFGQSKDFVQSMKFRDSNYSKILIGGILLFSAYGMYSLYKKIKK
jgi:hypothetical protein